VDAASQADTKLWGLRQRVAEQLNASSAEYRKHQSEEVLLRELAKSAVAEKCFLILISGKSVTK
jgi:hypothetical protein